MENVHVIAEGEFLNHFLMLQQYMFCITNTELPRLSLKVAALNHFPHTPTTKFETTTCYEGHLESKEHFAIKKYLLIIGKKKNMQVLSHTFTYFST